MEQQIAELAQKVDKLQQTLDLMMEQMISARTFTLSPNPIDDFIGASLYNFPADEKATNS